jgi:hypothetical protein
VRAGRQCGLLVVAFLLDVGFFCDRYFVQKLLAGDVTELAILVLAGLGFAFLLARHRFPVAVFWLTLAHSLAISALSNQTYTPLVAVWLAMSAVAASRAGLVRYVVLLATAVPTLEMLVYLYRSADYRTTFTGPYIATELLLITTAFWQYGARKRRPVSYPTRPLGPGVEPA